MFIRSVLFRGASFVGVSSRLMDFMNVMFVGLLNVCSGLLLIVNLFC